MPLKQTTITPEDAVAKTLFKTTPQSSSSPTTPRPIDSAAVDMTPVPSEDEAKKQHWINDLDDEELDLWLELDEESREKIEDKINSLAKIANTDKALRTARRLTKKNAMVPAEDIESFVTALSPIQQAIAPANHTVEGDNWEDLLDDDALLKMNRLSERFQG